jgi:hypothetical protein
LIETEPLPVKIHNVPPFWNDLGTSDLSEKRRFLFAVCSNKMLDFVAVVEYRFNDGKNFPTGWKQRNG